MVPTAAASTYPVGLRERLGISASSSRPACFALSAVDDAAGFFFVWSSAGLACGSAGLCWAGIHAGRVNAAIRMSRFIVCNPPLVSVAYVWFPVVEFLLQLLCVAAQPAAFRFG